MKEEKKQNGYIILISVMLIGAVAVTIAVSLLVMGIGSGKSSLSLSRSRQARTAAHSCIDDALIEIYKNNSYTGSASAAIGGYTCNFTVTNTGGNNRTIDVYSIVGSVTKKMRVQIDSVNPINIIYWQELAEL